MWRRKNQHFHSPLSHSLSLSLSLSFRERKRRLSFKKKWWMKWWGNKWWLWSCNWKLEDWITFWNHKKRKEGNLIVMIGTLSKFLLQEYSGYREREEGQLMTIFLMLLSYCHEITLEERIWRRGERERGRMMMTKRDNHGQWHSCMTVLFTFHFLQFFLTLSSSSLIFFSSFHSFLFSFSPVLSLPFFPSLNVIIIFLTNLFLSWKDHHNNDDEKFFSFFILFMMKIVSFLVLLFQVQKMIQLWRKRERERDKGERERKGE